MRFHFHPHFGRHRGHGGGRGSGRFGQGFMDGGMGGRAFGMGRKLASPDLQLLILALLDEKPRHGYEIIKALEERSKGFYVPSPGMVYPALTYLEEIGHATVEADGSRKRYHITVAGRAHLTAQRATADALLAQFARVGERMDRVRAAMGAQEAEVSAAAAAGRGGEELARAAHDLRAALADKRHSPPEERQRVADVLRRATAAILGSEPPAS